MATVQSEVFEAFRDLGIAEDKAMKAASALGKRDTDVSEVKRDIAVLRWMVGTNVALTLAILLKLFIH